MMNRQIRVEKIIGTVKCRYLWHNRNSTRQNVKFICFANKFSYLFGRCRHLRSVTLSCSSNKTA